MFAAGGGLLSTLVSLTGDPVQDVIIVFGSVTTFLSFVSMYGFAYKIAVGSKLLAIITLFLNLAAMLLSLYLMRAWQVSLDDIWDVFFTLLGGLLVVLLFYPLYGYAFKSNEVWGSA